MRFALISLAVVVLLADPLPASAHTEVAASPVLANSLWSTLSKYNTRIVLLGTTILGICGGVAGVFMLLRKRSLVGDVVGHASLPGIAIAFLIMEAAESGSGRTLSGLLAGATVSAIIGVLATLVIVKYSRVKEDAALAIVLSIFYGLGIALFTIVQDVNTGSQAGLDDFIFGQAALMILADVKLIAWASLAVLIVCCLLYKEFALLCFDQEFASSLGWPTGVLDLLLMAIVVAVTVVGLQSVGLILVVAILIIPAAAARFWSDHLIKMTMISAGIGGASAFVGVTASSLNGDLPAGATIVVIEGICFLISMLFGARRGIVYRLWNQRVLRERVGRHDLLRATYELIEARHPAVSTKKLLKESVGFEELKQKRTWSAHRIRRLLANALRKDLIWRDSNASYRLTAQGAGLARKAARNHRMWELFLIHYADIAPAQVDRDADRIEHILEPAMIAELESLMNEESDLVPESPHEIAGPAT